MSVSSISGKVEAVLIFADIVDSSKLSSFLTFTEYAKRLSAFRDLFQSLGKKYFPPPADKTIEFRKVDARGDEGTIFCISRGIEERRALVFKAIEFLYHLKGHLYIGLENLGREKSKPESPLHMELGAGIHCGTVAYATGLRETRLEITQIDGFAINKAKRVESASRLGNFSKILLSKEAAQLLEGFPILLSRITASMKGIEEHADLFEVKSGLFNGLIIETPSDQKLIDFAMQLAVSPRNIDEPWLKSLIISILDIMIAKTPVLALKEEYRNHQMSIAWNSSNEDDPILLYLRSRDYQEQEKHTNQIRYLKQVLETHPEFVFAKKRMVEACWNIAKQDRERSEKVFARDVAEEFLTNFSQFLTEDEKRQFQEIVTSAKK